jgi:lipopolysaccharide/colanic/teichoic acid biosynthesis glycosyltransferase
MRTATPVFDEVATTSPSRDTRMNSYEAIKPVVDFTLALVILMVSAPVVVVAMLLVRLTSRGPAIYTQTRLGQGGTIFTIFKIRTMYLDSERHCGPTWSVPGDPRVTPVGRILRWCHVDELPQLINILRGEMSLVGPRPERPEIATNLEDDLAGYPLRLAVRPGLTGLAQVQQPPDTGLESVRRKLTYDLYYIDRICLWLDLRIVIGTALKCLGVPFATIGWILQLHDPNAPFGCDSVMPASEMTAKTLVSDSYLM